MKNKLTTIKSFLAIPIFLLVFFGIFQCRADLDEGKYYVRIRNIENVLTVQRSTEIEAEEATVNMPIMAGDRIWTGEDGRAELIFEDGTMLRIGHFTKLDFQAVSYYSKEYDNSTILRLWAGSIYVAAINIEDTKRNFQIDTPASSIYLISDGRFRIDVFEEGETRLTSLNGVAEIVSAGESVLVKSGQRSYANLEGSPSTAESFNSMEMDEFDKWNEEQDTRYAESISQEYVTEQVIHHVHELDTYGSWYYHPIHHVNVWRPRVSIGWRPYLYGYWRWYPCGWTWISYEPWGWAPYHYGWWDWSWDLGWYWYPGMYWSPAWVSWAVGPGYIGWRPINYFNYYKYNYYNYKNFDPNYWTFIPRNAINRKDIRKVKYNAKEIRDLNVNRTQLYQPRLRTAHSKQPIDTTGGKHVIKDLKSIPRDIAKTKVGKTTLDNAETGRVYSHQKTTPDSQKSKDAVLKTKTDSERNKIESGKKAPSTKKKTSKPSVKSKSSSRPTKPSTRSTKTRTGTSPKTYSRPKSTKSKSTTTKPKPNNNLRSSANSSYQTQLARRNFSYNKDQNKSSYRKAHSNTVPLYNNANIKRTLSNYYAKRSNNYQRPSTSYRQSQKNNYSSSSYRSSYRNNSNSKPSSYYRYSRPSINTPKSSINKYYNRSYSSPTKSRTYTPSYNRSLNNYRVNRSFKAIRSNIRPSYRNYSNRSYTRSSGSSSRSYSYSGSRSSSSSYRGSAKSSSRPSSGGHSKSSSRPSKHK